MLKPASRAIFVVLTAILAVAFGAQVAFAGSPHFVGTPTISRDGDALTASGTVAGLGDETQITVALTAENKHATIAEGTFPVQNGKALFSVTGTGTTDPDCDPPMTLQYTNVVVTVSGDSFDPDLVFAFGGTL